MLVRCNCGWEKDVRDDLHGKVLVCPKCERQFEASPVDDSEGWLPPGVEIGTPDETTFIRPSGRIELSDETKRFLETRPSGPPPKPKVTWFHHAVVLFVFVGVPFFVVRSCFHQRGIEESPELTRERIAAGEICRSRLVGLRRFGVDDAANDALYEAERANDLAGIGALALAGRIVAVGEKDKLRMLRPGLMVSKVRIETGEFAGMTAMIPPEFLTTSP